MPARQHGAPHGGDPVDFRELVVGLGEVAELQHGVGAPQVTPQCRDRVACRPPERHRLAAEFEPFGDGLRDRDRQVPGGQGLEDRLRLAGPFGLGHRLRCQLGRARAAFALRDPDRELRVQTCAGSVLARGEHSQGALADRGDGAVGGAADAMDDQACLREQVRPARSFGEVGRCRAAADAGLYRVGEKLCLGQQDQQPRPLSVIAADLFSAAEREFGVADRVVVGQCPPCLAIGSFGPDPALPGRVPAVGAVPVRGDHPCHVRLSDLGVQLGGPAVKADPAAWRQLGVDGVADQRVLKPQPAPQVVAAYDADYRDLVPA